jgi:glutaredoxin
MFKDIVDAVGASSDLLELPLSFYQKTIAVEEGFTTAPVFRLNANSMGGFADLRQLQNAHR